MTANLTPAPRWFALPLLALGVLGFASAWLLLALRFDHHLAWLAPLAAADMVLLLAAARYPAGLRRSAWAVGGCAATIAIANFGIIAGQVGMDMGMRPWESALRLGPAYAWELAHLANTPADLAWYGLALAVAAWAGLSARRRAP